MLDRINIEKLIDEVHGYQNQLDPDAGIKTLRRWNTAGSLAEFFLILSMASGYHLYELGHKCNPQFSIIDTRTGKIFAEYLNESIVWNQNLEESYLKLISQFNTLPIYFKISPLAAIAFFNDHFKEILLQLQVMYDKNANGIFGEPGENETCKWILDHGIMMCYIICGTMLSSFMIRALKTLKTLFCPTAVNSNSSLKNENYLNVYQELDDELFKLANDIDEFDRDEKEELHKLNLLDKDYRPYWQCALSKRIIVQPFKLISVDNRQTRYDFNHIESSIKEKFRNPELRSQVKEYGFYASTNRAHKAYLCDLYQRVNEIKARKDFALSSHYI